jgi:parallel beta-helix repeat protein
LTPYLSYGKLIDVKWHVCAMSCGLFLFKVLKKATSIWRMIMKTNKAFFILTIIFVWHLVFLAFATTYYVNGSAGNDSYDGLAPTWDGTHGPKKTIQAGINISANTDTVIVADGTYTGAGNRNLDFEGREIILRSENGAETCIINCEASRANPRRGFYFHSEETLLSILDGFMIINGFSNGTGIQQHGGGILCVDSGPTITNCIITYCGAMLGGTAIEIYGNSSPLIYNCMILNNSDSSMNSSGGISLWSTGQPTIEYCTISYNVCGIRCGASSPIIRNCIIKFNFETGVYLYRSNPSISDCTIKANRGTDGGGIYYEWSSGTLSNCIINGNTASGDGAGIYLWDRCNPQINACEISNNWAFESGGAVDCQADSNPVITNCIIRSNSAHKVGGAFSISSTSSLAIANSTILNNTADAGGDWFYCSNNSIPVAVNCIIRGETTQPIQLFESSQPIITYSNIEGGYSGIGNIDTDPKFKNVFLHDYSLLSDSPCIDAGTSDSAPLSDFRGELRYDYQNMPNSGGGSLPYYDIGAFEFVDHDGDGLPDFWEIENGLDPYDDGAINQDNGSNGDPDSDSANNMTEYLADSNPLNNDTDGDGRDDFQEILEGTNPKHPDNSEKTYYVDTVIGSDSLNGLSPYPNGLNGPKKTIQAGLDAAASGWGYIILVANGTYQGEGNTNLNFKGKALTLKSVNGREHTTIDCQNNGRAFWFKEAEGADTIVEGFRVINCLIQPTSPFEVVLGGALRCSGASPTITNCEFGSNTAYMGGAIYLDLSRSILSDCILNENRALTIGGGMYISKSIAKISSCIINGNYATENSGEGGGVYLFYAEPTFSKCNITLNSALYGGGISSLSSNTIISDSSITYNDATLGGGFYHYSGRIERSTIANNHADDKGGGAYLVGTGATIFDCLIRNNTSGNRGGGLHCIGSPTITNCTITSNYAITNGGGMYSEGNGHPVLKDCILWNDVPGEISYDGASSLPTITYCDIQWGWAGIGNLSSDPLFCSGPLHDFYLSQKTTGQQTNSPCINTGSDMAANLGLGTLTTRIDSVPDMAKVDIGYHALPHVFRIYSVTRSGSDITISWTTKSGISYIVQWSYDRITWNDVPIGETDNWTDIGGVLAPQKFYRVKQ